MFLLVGRTLTPFSTDDGDAMRFLLYTGRILISVFCVCGSSVVQVVGEKENHRILEFVVVRAMGGGKMWWEEDSTVSSGSF